MGQTDSDDIWAFVLRLYGQPGVPQACLDLQDGFGIDVSLLLFSAWLARRGTALDAARAAAARDMIAPWHQDVVRTLRRVRQRLKTGPAPAPSPATDALREGVKKVEMESEKLELLTLAAFGAAWAPGADAAVEANLAEMFSTLTGARQDAPGLATIAQAVREIGQ